MVYNLYKHMADENFQITKMWLSKFGLEIQESFVKELKYFQRADDSEYLILNFSILNDNRFEGHLAILFEDLPNSITFEIAIVKTIDKKEKRYFRKVTIRDHLSIQTLEMEMEGLIRSGIKRYFSLTEEDLIDHT